MRVIIDENGIVHEISSERLFLAEGGKSARASHVLPVGWLSRVCFRLLRRLCGDEGRAAAWTRRWRCQWRVDMRLSGGGIVGPFDCRRSAIEYEVEWLAGRLSGGKRGE